MKYNISTTGETVRSDVSPYTAVVKVGNEWRPAMGTEIPQAVYEDAGWIVQTGSQTFDPSAVIDVRLNYEHCDKPTDTVAVVKATHLSGVNSGVEESVEVNLHMEDGVVRLNSYSPIRYGVVYLSAPTSPGVPVMFITEKSTALEQYDPQTGVIMDGSSFVEFYQGNIMIERYNFLRDPAPYWSNGVSLPDEVVRAAAVIPMDMVEVLVTSSPIFKFTGDLSIHAVLTLIELAELLELRGSLPASLLGVVGEVPLSWRANTIGMIGSMDNYRFRSNELHRKFAEQQSLIDRASIIITDIIELLQKEEGV